MFVILTGPGGIGKTALALQWIHRHQDRLPDGNYLVDYLGVCARLQRTGDNRRLGVRVASEHTAYERLTDVVGQSIGLYVG